MALGLTDIKTADLENILRTLHQGELECPITPRTIAIAGLSYLSDRLQFLRQLDEPGVRAVLVATLAERRECERRVAAARQ